MRRCASTSRGSSRSRRARRSSARRSSAEPRSTPSARACARRSRGSKRACAELTARRAAIAFSERRFATLRDAVRGRRAAFRSAELAAVGANAEQAAAKQEQASAEKAREELARAEARLAELSRERRLHDELDRAFGDIRTDLNQEMRPELSDRASRYIRDLTDGRYTEIELDEQYNIIVLEDAIPKPVISGGEEDLANLVLRLAISEMIAERAGPAVLAAHSR